MTETTGNRSSPLPILIAVAVVVITLLAVTLLRMMGGSGGSDEGGVGRAVVGQNDALQREDYAAFRGYTCAAQQRTEAEVLSTQRQSQTTRGARFVDDVNEFVIDGGRATATVIYHFEQTPDSKLTTPMTFAREDGNWRVCSSGPA